MLEARTQDITLQAEREKRETGLQMQGVRLASYDRRRV